MTPPVNDHQAKTPVWEARADLVVIGSGVAGLTAALRAQALGLHVLVITKAAVADGNTRWAQGGVAVVLEHEHDLDDSVAKHAEDTFAAGAGLVDEAAARSILDGGPAAVARLRADGATFDSAGDGLLARAREGGHSAFRVIHAGGDATGAEVERALVARAGDARVPVLEHHIAVDALRTPGGRVAGVTVLDSGGVPGVVRAPAVLLASGGIGQLYQATSNPEIATGDGLALALRAGAAVADVEFVQFHPTVLYTPGARGRCPLVTEAVRGEGATLVDATGAPVMAGVHPLGDLAPRDVVSAAITRRMVTAPGGVDDHVFLDATSVAGFAARFPTVFAACGVLGLDPAVDPIPGPPGGGRHQGRPPGRRHHPRHGQPRPALPRRPGLPGAGERRAGRHLPDHAALPDPGPRARGRRRLRRPARARRRGGRERRGHAARGVLGHAVKGE
ncbi:FAD-binding protein [Amycolatopsis solani]|uniref:FAD-binding protein n=1 Tax=Amycolatopsis solani TaxID=3028615 RepID=UPI0025AF33BE|nr:FAD-binding protein [Amycolatopsis sp. MEP2-6]